MRGTASRVLSTVVEHNLLVVLVMLLVSGGVAYGITDLELQSESSGGGVGDTEAAQKLEYVQANYANQSDADRDPTAVYVRDADGNVLSKASLLESLRFQQTVRENDSVATALGDDGRVLGVSNAVATRLAGDLDATLDEQVAALEDASESEVERTVEQTLVEGSPALELLPNDYEPGRTSAESRRMIFQFASATAGGDASSDGGAGEASSNDGGEATEGVTEATHAAATRHLYDAAGEKSDPAYFTLGEHVRADQREQMNRDTMELILPVALGVILAVLAFAYRDLVDVIVGFTGVILAVVWMFGILGWLGVPAGITLVIGPVLIVGLSVDYGLHVFMRYRERRGDDDGIREPMLAGLSGVGVALGLVTITTAVGFLANLANDFTVIRELAVGITLGVVSSLVIFLTIVPALKVTVDSLLERVGLDRRKQPLGKTRLLKRFLGIGATAARKAAPVVVVLALLAGAAGGYAWTELDREAYQSDEDGVAEWKQNLPEPLAWEVHPSVANEEYVSANYRPASEDAGRTSQVLVEGDVTDPKTLERLDRARESVTDAGVVFERNGETPFVSPVTVMQSVAERDGEFADTLESADSDGDGVPDRNLERVYDALSDAAPERAALVVERTDGEYRSVRMLVPIRADVSYDRQVAAMSEAAATVEVDGGGDGSGDDGSLSASAVGRATVASAEANQTADGILETLVVALLAVGLILTLIYRGIEGSATLGAATAVPITLVTAFVVGGMYVFDVPLTLLTALLMSLVVGLGIDYNIHVSDRFAQELDAGRSVHDALHEAVTGTGGALLGSTLTSTGAFAALLLHPHPQITSFGTLVVLGLGTSFVVSVFVLPSLLVLWARRFHDDRPQSTTHASRSAPSVD